MITSARPGLATAAIGLLASFAVAAPPDTVWTRRFGGANVDCAYDIAIAADSGYLVAGYLNGHTASQVWYMHTDRDGRPTWQVSYATGYALDICPAANNCSYVGGSFRRTYPDSSNDAFVQRLEPDGRTAWYQTVADPNPQWSEYSRAVAETHDGGCVAAIEKVYMAGYVQLVRYSAAGTLLWNRFHRPRSYWSVPYWVGQMPDRGFAVAGHSSAGTEGDFFLLRTDSLGDTLWCRTWGNHAGFDEERAYDACATRDNGFALFGYRESESRRADFWLVRTDSAGDTLWTRTYGNDGTENGWGICEMPDRGFTLCGGRFFGGPTGIYIVRTDSLGDTLWTKSMSGSQLDCGYAVQPTPEGDIVVAGRKSDDAWLVKLDGQTGVVEETRPTPVPALPATMVGRALYRAEARPADLVDAAGRTVLRLRRGENDLGDVRAGVYLVKPLGAAPYSKVVVCR